MANENGTLLEVIRRHRMVYEVRPAISMATGQRAHIGFDVVLYGTGDADTTQMTPGDDRSFGVWEHLHQVGATALPRKANGVSCDIESFRAALVFDQKRQRPDVELTLTIRRRADVSGDEACLHDICAALRAAGVQEGTWSDARSAPNGAH